jgi:hypothetical protein
MWYALTLRGPRLLMPVCVLLLCAALAGAAFGLYWSAEYSSCLTVPGGLHNLLTLTPCTPAGP